MRRDDVLVPANCMCFPFIVRTASDSSWTVAAGTWWPSEWRRLRSSLWSVGSGADAGGSADATAASASGPPAPLPVLALSSDISLAVKESCCDACGLRKDSRHRIRMSCGVVDVTSRTEVPAKALMSGQALYPEGCCGGATALCAAAAARPTRSATFSASTLPIFPMC